MEAQFAQGGFFFERLIKGTKSLLKKELYHCRLTYEDYQIILFEGIT